MKQHLPFSKDAGGAPPDLADGADDGECAQLIARHCYTPGGLLPLLHDIQEALGYIPDDGVPAIARAFHLSRAEVHGVISYYAHFRTQAPGRHVLQICRAESCKANGGDALLAQAERMLGCAAHHTSADGAVTLEPVFCLGLCAVSPALRIDDQLHGRMDQDKLRRLLQQLGEA